MRDYAMTNGLAAFPKAAAAGTRRNLIDGKDARYINKLISINMIEVHENGWIVIDPGSASAMMLKRNSDKQ